MNSRFLWAALVLPALLAACAKPQVAAPQSRRPIYAADLAGAAKTCTVENDPKLVDAQQTVVPMTLANDGGWCGLRVSRPGPEPFDAGLLVGRPEHGRVHVHAVGDWTRIDYTPDPGYTGGDTFTVRLLPGSTTVRVNVTVEAGPAPVVPAAVTPRVTAPPPDRPATTPPARRAR